MVTQSPAALREALLRTAAALLWHLDGPAEGTFRVELSQEDRTHAFRGPAAASPPGLGDLGPERAELLAMLAGRFLSPLEARIVLLLADGPVTAGAMERQLGDVSETKLKLTRAELVQRKVLRSAECGYELTDPRFLELARQGASRFGQEG